MDTERVKIKTAGGYVSGLMSIPEGYDSNRRTGFIMAHGAGNDMHSPFLEFFAGALTRAGHFTLRFNFPYKEKGKKAPDRPEVLERTWSAAMTFLRSDPVFSEARIYALGKSMGGRIASHLAARQELSVEALIFLGYPLHPPGKKEKLRDAHLYAIDIPMLFFAGTRDPLCDLGLLNQVLPRLKAPWFLEVVEGGDHSFKVLKSMGLSQEDVYRGICRRVLDWIPA